MGLIIDLILFLIILFVVFLSARKGFVAVFVEIVGFILAFVLAFSLSTPISGYIYDKAIEPSIIEDAKDYTHETGNSFYDSLPDFITDNAEKIGITAQTFDSAVTSNMDSGVENATREASQTLLKPTVVKMLEIIVTLVLIFILMFVVKILAKWLNRLFSFSIIGKVNKILGAIAGIPKGIIFAALFCLIINFVLIFEADGFWIFTPKNLSASTLFDILSKIF